MKRREHGNRRSSCQILLTRKELIHFGGTLQLRLLIHPLTLFNERIVTGPVYGMSGNK